MADLGALKDKGKRQRRRRYTHRAGGQPWRPPRTRLRPPLRPRSARRTRWTSQSSRLASGPRRSAQSPSRRRPSRARKTRPKWWQKTQRERPRFRRCRRRRRRKSRRKKNPQKRKHQHQRQQQSQRRNQQQRTTHPRQKRPRRRCVAYVTRRKGNTSARAAPCPCTFSRNPILIIMCFVRLFVRYIHYVFRSW